MHSKRFPLLPKSYRKHFPFRICAPSFIYPDAWADNVKLLGPYLDEIELLFLESTGLCAFPEKSDVTDLAGLMIETGISYNVHLPTDISPGAIDSIEQQRAINTIHRVMDLAEPLSPTTWTLHLPLDPSQSNEKSRHAWIKRLLNNLETLFSKGVDPKCITIETLDYPFDWIDDILSSFDVGVCMDIGHLLLSGTDIHRFFETYEERIHIIHLHGVLKSRDHLPLTAFSHCKMTEITQLIAGFRGTVSVEVFNFDSLDMSLRHLENAWEVCRDS